MDTINTYIEDRHFEPIFSSITKTFKKRSHEVHPHYWQASDVSARPDMLSHELLNVTIHVVSPVGTTAALAEDIKPNLPWADDHFAERTGGHPLNPGTEWANWPWGINADKFRKEQIFNHTYSERLWPRHAGMAPATGGVLPDHHNLPAHRGIRHIYGDLHSLVDLLVKDPLTRQAVIPLFFPEDTGIGDGDRKPCTLLYQFIVRDNKLHTYYPIRSCDFVRHMRDDIYLALRLSLWILNQCRDKSPYFDDIALGSFTMQMTSLHIFANDFRQL